MRLRWFLTISAILLATVGLTVVASEQLDACGDADDQVIGGDGGPGSSPTTTAEPGPPPGQVRVTGAVTAVHLEGAVLDPREIATPLIVLSDRGFGNGGEITGIQVEGGPASVVWDGGRPFVLSSGGALVLDPVTIDLAPDGLRVALGGTVARLAPGAYQLDTPVAVGSTGVAEARDAVAFQAGSTSSFAATGDANLVLTPAAGPRHLLGPGTVHLEGALELTDATGTRAVASVDAAVGAFDLVLTPVATGGWTVTATLQGQTTST